MSKPVDELDEILDDYATKYSQLLMRHDYMSGEMVRKHRAEAKARLLQWGTRQVIKELQNQRIRFEVPEEELGINGYPRPGAAGRNALKRKELHYLDKKIAELQASLKDGGTK